MTLNDPIWLQNAVYSASEFRDVLEVFPGEREPVEALVRTAMADAAELSVPLDVSVGFGATWQEAAH